MKILIAFVVFAVGAVALVLLYCSRMPGESAAAVPATSTDAERAAAERMEDDCLVLARNIGNRSSAKAENVSKARDYLEQRMGRSGLRPKEKPFNSRGEMGVNIESVLEGTTSAYEVVVIGAHYDTAAYTPGGDDNASGCAMLIEVGHELSKRNHDRTIEIVMFDRGASRFAGTDSSGSEVWADEAKKANKKIVAMLSLDCVGKFTDAPGSQGGPFPLTLCYPTTGNFLLFAGDFGSRELVQKCVETFRGGASFPCEGVTLPELVPGIECSDHAAFRKRDWPAVLVTDTGSLRNAEHGQMTDSPDRLNFDRMAKAAAGLVKVVEFLARKGTATSVMN